MGFLTTAILGGSLLGAAALSKGRGPTKTQQQAETAATEEQLALAREQAERERLLFATGMPLVQRAIERYQKLIEKPFLGAAPAIEEAARRTYGLEEQIRSELPRGGGQEVALAQNRLALGRQAADITSAIREGSYAALLGTGTDLLGRSAVGAATAGTLFGSLLPSKAIPQSVVPGLLGQAAAGGTQALFQWLLSRTNKPTTSPGGP